jgi:hypothetical protein
MIAEIKQIHKNSSHCSAFPNENTIEMHTPTRRSHGQNSVSKG